jgi:hypothetical protein
LIIPNFDFPNPNSELLILLLVYPKRIVDFFPMILDGLLALVFV